MEQRERESPGTRGVDGEGSCRECERVPLVHATARRLDQQLLTQPGEDRGKVPPLDARGLTQLGGGHGLGGGGDDAEDFGCLLYTSDAADE